MFFSVGIPHILRTYVNSSQEI